MAVNINKNLDLNITDFLLLQEISEMKLNRRLGADLDTGDSIRFYDSYKSYLSVYNEVNINEIKNQFYTAIGATPNIDNTPLNDYMGGAGAYTKISQTQADYFLDNFKILDYYGNDNTGFSATTFIKNSDILVTNGEKKLQEITISFRSTEFTEDYYKDASGADDEISKNGTAIAQNIALVNYLKKLKTDGIITSTTKINITGYSLGGHLASSAYQYLQ